MPRQGGSEPIPAPAEDGFVAPEVREPVELREDGGGFLGQPGFFLGFVVDPGADGMCQVRGAVAVGGHGGPFSVGGAGRVEGAEA